MSRRVAVAGVGSRVTDGTVGLALEPITRRLVAISGCGKISRLRSARMSRRRRGGRLGDAAAGRERLAVVEPRVAMPLEAGKLILPHAQLGDDLWTALVENR